MAHGGLHRLGRPQHERQLHLARREQVADGLHAGEQHIVDDAQRVASIVECLIEVVFEADAVSVDDAVLETPLDGPVGAVVGRGGLRLDVLERGQQLLQRVPPRGAAVVDEVQAERNVLGRNLVQRHDLAGVRDGRVEARLDALVEEDRVEDPTGRRLEPERDVRDT